MFSSTSVHVINHVLGQHAWARQLLAAHHGKTVRIRTNLPALPLLGAPPEPYFQITGSGLLDAAADPGTAAGVTISFAQEDGARSRWLADLLEQGPAAVQRAAHVEGDAELALCLGQIAQHLRWDPAEDIAKLTGDVFAQRLVDGLDAFAAGLKSMAVKGQGQLHRKLTGADDSANASLVSRAQAQEFAGRVSQLQAATEQLESRLNRLERRYQP